MVAGAWRREGEGPCMSNGKFPAADGDELTLQALRAEATAVVYSWEVSVVANRAMQLGKAASRAVGVDGL